MLQFNFKPLSVSSDKTSHTSSGLLKVGREHPCHGMGSLSPGMQQRRRKHEPVCVHKKRNGVCDTTLQDLSFPAACPFLSTALQPVLNL